MTVENDGLPLQESAAYDAGHTDVDLPSTADQPTQELPLGPPPGGRRGTDSTTDGSMEGDLFDGIADR